jgi:hypothetical protein
VNAFSHSFCHLCYIKYAITNLASLCFSDTSCVPPGVSSSISQSVLC